MRVRWLERFAIAIASLVLAVVLIALLSGYFTGKDQAAVTGGNEVGLKFTDQGNTPLTPGYPRPHYDSDPPTSGPHLDRAVRANGETLSDDQILTALAAGDVVVLYGTPRAPDGVPRLGQSLLRRRSSAASSRPRARTAMSPSA